MNIQISHSSMIPIYEQIAEQIRSQIRNGQLKSEEPLPSVRSLAKDFRISALTAKKAYDLLEEEGMVCTIHGKGTYVSKINPNLLQEEMQKQLEESLLQAIQKAKLMKMSDEDIVDLVSLLLEEYK